MQKILKLYPHEQDALQKLKQWIDQHPGEMLSLRELCVEYGMNRDKLKKGFLFLFGLPPYTYHLRVKMEEANRLLLQTDSPIHEIAFLLGYQQVCSFCTAFKNHTGSSPGQFRIAEVIALTQPFAATSGLLTKT